MYFAPSLKGFPLKLSRRSE